jgi:hypothetical protein
MAEAGARPEIMGVGLFDAPPPPVEPPAPPDPDELFAVVVPPQPMIRTSAKIRTKIRKTLGKMLHFAALFIGLTPNGRYYHDSRWGGCTERGA